MSERHISNVSAILIDANFDMKSATVHISLEDGSKAEITGPMPDVQPIFDALINFMYAAEEADEADCDDEDDGAALASASFGTDEDYGGPMQ